MPPTPWQGPSSMEKFPSVTKYFWAQVECSACVTVHRYTILTNLSRTPIFPPRPRQDPSSMDDIFDPRPAYGKQRMVYGPELFHQ